jgi:hypothetical protein
VALPPDELVEPDEEPSPPLGAMQTPAQARLQQSDHEAHEAPTS